MFDVDEDRTLAEIELIVGVRRIPRLSADGGTWSAITSTITSTACSAPAAVPSEPGQVDDHVHLLR